MDLEPTNFMAAWERAPLRIAKAEREGALQDLIVCRNAMRFLFGMVTAMLGRNLETAQRSYQAEFASLVLLTLGERFAQIEQPGEVTSTLAILDTALRNLRSPLPKWLEARCESLRGKAR